MSLIRHFHARIIPAMWDDEIENILRNNIANKTSITCTEKYHL